MSNNHTIHSLQHHFGWDNANKPVIGIKSGETIEIDTVDSSGSQLNIDSTIDFLNKKFAKNVVVKKEARPFRIPKNINLVFPKNKLIVFTGISGSGKSSLAFDTPTNLLNLCVPPHAGINPRLTSGCENLALSEEILMSHASASSFPPPYAAPFIAATTGLPTPDNFLKTFCPNSITANTSFGSVNCANDFMSCSKR